MRMDTLSGLGLLARLPSCSYPSACKGSADLDALDQARGLDENIQFDGGTDEGKKPCSCIHATGLTRQTCALFCSKFVHDNGGCLDPAVHQPSPLPESLHTIEHTYLQSQMLETESYAPLEDFIAIVE
ncbi:uncharacterized protein ARMOST_14891 [Armillaria ostoyae]|uniref:Uncharacterized protein n=1 Tax=Armillaria ostoyae TaxID=47428 RepID=A0A284RRU4_ARMOS|nr:uncharacterized protein ARMOST_14891 [Armillaria ostoyae]